MTDDGLLSCYEPDPDFDKTLEELSNMADDSLKATDVTPEERLVALQEQVAMKELISKNAEQYANKLVAAYNSTGSLPTEYSTLSDYLNMLEDNLRHEAIERGRLTQGAQIVLDLLKSCLMVQGIMMPKATDSLIEYIKLSSSDIDQKLKKQLLSALADEAEYIGNKHLKYVDRIVALTRAFYVLCSMLEPIGNERENYGAILMRATGKRPQNKSKSKEGRPKKKLNPMLDVEGVYGKQD